MLSSESEILIPQLKFQPPDLQLEFCVSAAKDTKQKHLLFLEVASLRATQQEPGPRGMRRSPSGNIAAESGASYRPGGDQVHSRHSWRGCGALPSAESKNQAVLMEILWHQIHSPTIKLRRLVQLRKKVSFKVVKLSFTPPPKELYSCSFTSSDILRNSQNRKMSPI